MLIRETEHCTEQILTKVIPAQRIQAVILTKNEEPNIKRVMDRLQWLERVVVIDSFSTDATLEILRCYPNAAVYQRAFDTHARQWNYGLSLCATQWILSLDADYVLSDTFVDEIKTYI